MPESGGTKTQEQDSVTAQCRLRQSQLPSSIIARRTSTAATSSISPFEIPATQSAEDRIVLPLSDRARDPIENTAENTDAEQSGPDPAVRPRIPSPLIYTQFPVRPTSPTFRIASTPTLVRRSSQRHFRSTQYVRNLHARRVIQRHRFPTRRTAVSVPRLRTKSRSRERRRRAARWTTRNASRRRRASRTSRRRATASTPWWWRTATSWRRRSRTSRPARTARTARTTSTSARTTTDANAALEQRAAIRR